MRSLYVLMGKSASGKDTLAKKLQERGLRREPTYTTRPLRPGEKPDVEYHFLYEEDFWNRFENGFFLETRDYDTEYGTWHYGSTLETYRKSDFVILTPEGLEAVRSDLEKAGIHPVTVYLDVPERIRIRRSIERDGIGKLDEIFRRAEADEKDFAGFRADITLDGSAEGLDAFVDMLAKAPMIS